MANNKFKLFENDDKSPRNKYTLTPNSGHQNIWIPLIPFDPAHPEDTTWPDIMFKHNKELQLNSREIKDNHGELLDLLINAFKHGSKSPWVYYDKKPWIRHRITKEDIEGSEYKMLVIQLFIETNIGSFSRGETLDVITPEELSEESKSPYIVENMTHLAVGPQKYFIRTKFSAEDEDDEDKFLVVPIQVSWQQSGGESLPVDLAVDLGNSRSVILAYEEQPGSTFNQICRPIRFLDPQKPYAPNELDVMTEDCIPESFMSLHESVFKEIPEYYDIQYRTQRVKDHIWSKAKPIKVIDKAYKRQSQMFVEASNAYIGEKSSEALKGEPNSGRCLLSSPKRYLWDVEEINLPEWTMLPLRGNKVKDGVVKRLSGRALKYQSTTEKQSGFLEEELWDISNPPSTWEKVRRPSAKPDHTTYSRSQSFTWLALSILETAYRQINSEKWRSAWQPSLSRKLRSINVTYPSGWTDCEMTLFKRRWSEAINIFAATHLADERDIPKFELAQDEGVVVQLPVLYAQMRVLNNVGDNWMDIYGRQLNDNHGGTARVMSIDIGGGTTDIAIIDHTDKMKGAGVQLNSQLIFRDSSLVAGDEILKKFLEDILLPQMAIGGSEEIQKEWTSFWVEGKGVNKDLRPLILQGYLLPMIKSWIGKLIDGKEAPEFRWDDSTSVHKLSNLLKDINIEFVSFLNSSPLIPPAKFEQLLWKLFEKSAESWAAYFAAFNVDILMISGKPSEIPQIQQIIKDKIPAFEDRIVFTKDFIVGDWYPMSRNGRIADAKTVTAVGVALAKSMNNGFIQNWSIRRNSEDQFDKSYWGVVIAHVSGTYSMDQGRFLMTPDQLTGECQLMPGQQIGRQFFKGTERSEANYQLVIKSGIRDDDKNRLQGSLITIKCKRLASKGEQADSLELVSATLQETGEVINELVELRLKTMGSSQHWIDSGRLDISSERPQILPASKATTQSASPAETALSPTSTTQNDDSWDDGF